MLWNLSKYVIVVLVYFITLCFFLDNYIQFAIISELCWLNFYLISLVTASKVEDSELYIISLLILLLTAIECIVLWSLIYIIKNKN